MNLWSLMRRDITNNLQLASSAFVKSRSTLMRILTRNDARGTCEPLNLVIIELRLEWHLRSPVLFMWLPVTAIISLLRSRNHRLPRNQTWSTWPRWPGKPLSRRRPELWSSWTSCLCVIRDGRLRRLQSWWCSRHQSWSVLRDSLKWRHSYIRSQARWMWWKLVRRNQTRPRWWW